VSKISQHLKVTLSRKGKILQNQQFSQLKTTEIEECTFCAQIYYSTQDEDIPTFSLFTKN
jgi:hypothetical protein